LFFPLFKNQANEQMDGPTGSSMESMTAPLQLQIELQNGIPVVVNQTPGSTGIQGPTGPSQEILSLFPSANTGPVESPYIATLDELLSSYESTVAQETADRTALSVLVNPSRESFRPQLFQWAAAGFPNGYIIQSISINPPNICSDGVSRNVGKYVEYCIGTNLGAIIQSMTALMTGINPTWSTLGNTIRIHVTRA
jgi:hypothetical protein